MRTKTLIKTAVNYWQPAEQLKVDRKALKIYDVVAMQANVEALGHDLESDQKTIEIAAKLANESRPQFGIQGRFGHPGMSENAAGKKIMTSHNFHVEGDKLLHDIHLMESARKSPAFSQDPLEYIMDMAENQPEELAESAVMYADMVWTFADGTEFDYFDSEGMKAAGHDLFEINDAGDERPVDALSYYPVMRPTTFFYLDIVNEGALTHDGLFNSEIAGAMLLGTSGEMAKELFDSIDAFREEYGISLAELPEKVDDFVERYVHSRGTGKMATKRTQAVSKNRGRAQFAGDPPNPTKPADEEDEPEVEVTVTVPVGDSDPLDDAADEAEGASPPAAESPDEGSAEQSELSQAVDYLLDRNAKLERLALAQQGVIRNVLTRLSALEAEPMGTARVSSFNRQFAAQRGMAQQPAPAAKLLSAQRQPKSVGERFVEEYRQDEPGAGDPNLATLNRSNRRNAAVNS